MNKEDWSNSWKKHLANYLKAPSRTGIFVKTYAKGIASSIELGCGSGRDSVYLAHKGIDAVAVDYESLVIRNLQEMFKDYPVKFCEADAFALPFPDHKFDLVFHNGLLIYFNKDTDIINLILEQKRVAKKYILILVHNGTNNRLVAEFETLASSDPVYDIRFFAKNVLSQIIKAAQIDAKSVRYLKFGGRFDVFYSRWIKKVIPNLLYPFREYLIPRMYQWQRWKKTERIACLIEL
jgi:ubiquinone/menaquinone biosynthesis C-methylase UbiE